MAATLGQIAYATQLKLGNAASPQVFTVIAEVVSINGFGFTAAEINATHMDSPNGYEEFVGGLKTGDTMTIVMNMIRANALQTKSVWDAHVRRDWELNFPNVADVLPDYDFSAVPMAWHIIGVAPGDLLQIEATMRITGSILGNS